MKRCFWPLVLALTGALGGCGGTEPLDSCGAAPEYQRDIYPTIVVPKCQSCHGSSRAGPSRNGAPENYVFDSFEMVKDQLGEVSNAMTSGLMPPAGNEGLTEAEIQLAVRWRACGFKP